MPAPLLVLALSPFLAAQPIIGVAVSSGNLIVDSATIAGTASLFEGSVIEAVDQTVQIRLRTGGTAIFAPHSAARISTHRLDLRRGAATVTGLDSSALGMNIHLGVRNAATLRIDGDAVEVIPLSGSAVIADSGGVAVGAVGPGKAVVARPAANPGAKPILTISGTSPATAAQPIVTSTATPVCLSPCSY